MLLDTRPALQFEMSTSTFHNNQESSNVFILIIDNILSYHH